MDTFLDVSGIVKRVKQAPNFKKDGGLASYLGVSRATLPDWCAKNRIDSYLLLNGTRGVDFNWLLVGKGTPRHQTRLRKSGLASGEVQMIHNPKAAKALNNRSVTPYDIITTTNLKALLTNKRRYMVGRIQTPSIPSCDEAAYVNSDNMYPILKSGDIVGLKEINSFSNLIYGEIYLVSLIIEGDEYLAMKYVSHSEKEGCLRLVSYNAHHDPMDIPFSTINAMVVTRFSIHRHMMV